MTNQITTKRWVVAANNMCDKEGQKCCFDAREWVAKGLGV